MPSYSLLVKAEPTVDQLALSESDSETAGEYVVAIDEDLPDEQRADAALDVFHSKVSIEAPEDFRFVVLSGGQELATNPHHDSYSLSGRGCVISGPQVV